MKWGSIIGEFIGTYVYAFLIALAILLVFMGPYMGIIEDTCGKLTTTQDKALCVYKISPDSTMNAYKAVIFFGFISMIFGYHLMGKDHLTWGIIIFFGGMHMIPYLNNFSWIITLAYLAYIYQ